jgi:hypothetical protein
MRGGHVDAITRRAVSGWAADPDRPDDHLAVSITVNGVRLGQVQADRLRKDLANLGRYGDGRHGFAFEFPVPLDPQQDHTILVRFADDGVKLPNGEHRLSALAAPVAPGNPVPVKPPPLRAVRPVPAAGGPGTALVPIMVTAPGRSGTTLLMGLLAKSPAIVAAELVPYELRLLSYYSAAFNVLTAPGDLEKSTHPDKLDGDGYHIGFNPFQSAQYAAAFRDRSLLTDYYQDFAPSRTLDYVRDMVGDYYGRLARDKSKPGARYFAEKGNNLHAPTRAFMRRVFGDVRELVILRDPRDVLCSHMAYFSSSPEKAFNQLSHASRQLLAIRAEALPDVHILKYEDMVRGDAACFTALSAFLDVKVEPETGVRPQEVFRRHGTSVSPQASVARWRTHLPEALKARCAQDWGHFLTSFGYDLA